jgi:hypothetical protein
LSYLFLSLFHIPLPSPHYIFCPIPTDSGNFRLYLTPPWPTGPREGTTGCCWLSPPFSSRGGVPGAWRLPLALTPCGGLWRCGGLCGGGRGRGHMDPAWRCTPGCRRPAPGPRPAAPPWRARGGSRTPLRRLCWAFFLRGVRRLFWLLGPVRGAGPLPLCGSPLASPPVACAHFIPDYQFSLHMIK